MNGKIDIKNVTKRYKSSIVLENISTTFEDGKIHGIVGRNGSGKTMLLKCLCGFVKISSGEIFFGEECIGKDIEVPRDIGIIIESPGFLEHESGYKNLKLLAMLKSLISKEEIKNAMTLVGLDPASKKKVGKYSLGMKQRLGIAQAIMESPKYLLLDEPMNGLDNRGVEEVRILLKKLNDAGTTIILTSHNDADIKILCDDWIEMDQGKIIARYSKGE